MFCICVFGKLYVWPYLLIAIVFGTFYYYFAFTLATHDQDNNSDYDIEVESRPVVHGPSADKAYQRMSVLMKDKKSDDQMLLLNSSVELDPFSSGHSS